MDEAKLQRIIHRGVAEIIPEGEFLQRLRTGQSLRLKMGFDPSKPDIHLGHVVGLRKLRQFQELGHHVILIVGDWTAQIGDPSGQSATRPVLTAQDVESNAKTYITQFFKVVDQAKTEVVWQSEWFGKFGLADVIDLTSRFTVAQFLAREDFSDRYHNGRPIALTEFLYPLLQAFDSVAVHADVEFGGTDQKFNLLVGRELQQMMGQPSQACFLMPILVGTDGIQKMSKSLGNYISIGDPPNEMYGKLMSIADHLLFVYLELLTDVPETDLKNMQQSVLAESMNPIEIKKLLGREVVATFHGAEAADQAQVHFERVYQHHDVPEDVREVFVAGIGDGVQVLVSSFLAEHNLVASRTEAKRLLSQGAIKIDGVQVQDDTIYLRYGSVFRIGRHRWARISRP